MIERVPFEEVEKFFANARLFVSTSVFEGFPNTFLQAAKYGVPIISTDVNPGEMLSEYGCGFACDGDFKQFTEEVKKLLQDDALYEKMSACGLDYVRKFHDKDAVLTLYENAFNKVLTEENLS